MSKRPIRLSVAAILAAALALASAPAYAQGAGTTALLTGLVTDAAGRVVSGTEVLVRNNATGAQFTAVTDDTGLYFVLAPAAPGYAA